MAYASDNWSVRSSIFMLYKLYEPTWAVPFEELDKLLARYNELKPEMSAWDWCGISQEEYEDLYE
jgi:hypothetical protein